MNFKPACCQYIPWSQEITEVECSFNNSLRYWLIEINSHTPALGSLSSLGKKKLRACSLLCCMGQLGAIMVSKCIEGYGKRNSCPVERDEGAEEQASVGGLLVIWCHGDIQSLAAARGHAWIYDPSADRVCVDVRGSCHHRRLWGSWGLGGHIWPHWCFRAMPPQVWVSWLATQGHGEVQAWALASRKCLGLWSYCN